MAPFIRFTITLVVLCLCWLNISCDVPPLTGPEPGDYLTIDSTYLHAVAGDPRGEYVPNYPFIYTFLPNDSLTSRLGKGTLVLRGATSTAGTFAIDLTTTVAGKGGEVTFGTANSYRDRFSGDWRVDGTTIYFRRPKQREESCEFTADSLGLYLIVSYYCPVIPFSENVFWLRALSSHDPTIWAFKKK